MSKDFVIKRDFQPNKVKVNNVKVMGCCSYDEDFNFKLDSSQLPYYNPPPRHTWANVSYDLDYEFDSIKKNPVDVNFMNIDDFLKWILLNVNKLQECVAPGKRLQADFVAMNGTFKKILNVPHGSYDGFIISASKFQGNIYLCVFDTKEKILKERGMLDNDDYKFLYWGFKFEQFVVSDGPNKPPNPSRRLNVAEGFDLFFQSNFGKHKLLYCAEIDGVISDKTLKEPIDWNNNQVKFVEVKTTHLRMLKNEYKFKMNKLRDFWSQIYFTNADHVLCGFRNDEGLVTKMHSYNLQELESKSKGVWSPNVSLNFLNDFLGLVKETVAKEHDQCSYTFTWYPGWDKIRVDEVDPTSEYAFLTEEFVKGMSDSVNWINRN